MKNPCVSVIVPIYKTERYLKRCLDSLVNQTLQNIEIILINDASPDASNMIIEDYRVRYPDKFVYVCLEQNKGPGNARNIGVQKAQGQYIMFVDCDDYVDCAICEKMYNKAVLTRSEIVVCPHVLEIEDTRTKIIMNTYSQEMLGELTNVKKAMLMTVVTAPWAKLFEREFFERYLYKFPIHIYCADMATIHCYFLQATRVSIVWETLYMYTHRKKSAGQNPEHFYDRIKAFNIFNERTKDEQKNQVIRYAVEQKEFRIRLQFLLNSNELIDKLNNRKSEELWEWFRQNDLRLRENPFYYWDSTQSIVEVLFRANSVDEMRKWFQDGTLNNEISYVKYYEMYMSEIQILLNKSLKNGNKLAIWGAGKRARTFLQMMDSGMEKIAYVIDSNDKLWNTKMPTGHRIKGYDEIKNEIDVILILNHQLYAEIRMSIKDESEKLVDLESVLLSYHLDKVENDCRR